LIDSVVGLSPPESRLSVHWPACRPVRPPLASSRLDRESSLGFHDRIAHPRQGRQLECAARRV